MHLEVFYSGMITAAGRRASTEDPPAPRFPAYGPIEGVLGVAMLYLVVARATPTFVTVLEDLAPLFDPATVRTILAVALWVVLAITLVEQVRRQLTALDLYPHAKTAIDPSGRPLSGRHMVGYIVVLVLGLLFIPYAYDAALNTAAAIIPIVAYQSVEPFFVWDFIVMVVFFITYGLTIRALDRLLVYGTRLALGERHQDR